MLFLQMKASSSILAPLLLLAMIQNVKAGCCSQNYKDCDVWWCGSSESSCEDCWGSSYLWLEDGALSGSCDARWSDCTNDKDACCDGLQCNYWSDDWSQCLPGEDDSEDEPEEGDGCCSVNFKTCDVWWCGSTEDECLNCEGEDEGTYWLEDGAQNDSCLARWSTCTDNKDGCCDGLTCYEFDEYYSQCLPDDDDSSDDPDPTPSPTKAATATPTASQRGECEDNANSFFFKGKDTSCQEIGELGAQKRARKCGEDRKIIEECPSICSDECATPSPTSSPTASLRGPCENNPDPFFFKGSDTTCQEIADLGPQKQKRKCEDGRKIRDECPAVCKEECL